MDESKKSYCGICYAYLSDSHSCVISPALAEYYTDSGVLKYKGVIKDNYRFVWISHFERVKEQDAISDSKEHIEKHKFGSCKCCYIVPPINDELRRSEKATLYIVKNDSLDSYKIGVSANSRGERISQHILNGWQIVKAWTNLRGVVAYNIEQTYLQEWRMKNFLPILTPKDMPSGGYSETVSYFCVSEREMQKICEDITVLLE